MIRFKRLDVPDYIIHMIDEAPRFKEVWPNNEFEIERCSIKEQPVPNLPNGWYLQIDGRDEKTFVVYKGALFKEDVKMFKYELALMSARCLRQIERVALTYLRKEGLCSKEQLHILHINEENEYLKNLRRGAEKHSRTRLKRLKEQIQLLQNKAVISQR